MGSVERSIVPALSDAMHSDAVGQAIPPNAELPSTDAVCHVPAPGSLELAMLPDESPTRQVDDPGMHPADASYYLAARHFVSSGGEHFFAAGRTVTLGQAGHFTFTATCSKDNTGQNQVTFDVFANTTAGLDGNPPQAAGNKLNIHTNSDALDTTADHTLNPGDFDQVGSASSSTEIAVDGQEADIFYNDGVNWPAGNGSRAHDCFAGYTGFLAGRS